MYNSVESLYYTIKDLQDELFKVAFISCILTIVAFCGDQISLIQATISKDTTCPSVSNMLLMGAGAAALTKALQREWF